MSGSNGHTYTYFQVVNKINISAQILSPSSLLHTCTFCLSALLLSSLLSPLNHMQLAFTVTAIGHCWENSEPRVFHVHCFLTTQLIIIIIIILLLLLLLLLLLTLTLLPPLPPPPPLHPLLLLLLLFFFLFPSSSSSSFLLLLCLTLWRLTTFICRTTQLTSRRCNLNIYSTNTPTEYFKHAAHPPYFSLQDAVYFIMLPFWVPVIFTF